MRFASGPRVIVALDWLTRVKLLSDARLAVFADGTLLALVGLVQLLLLLDLLLLALRQLPLELGSLFRSVGRLRRRHRRRQRTHLGDVLNPAKQEPAFTVVFVPVQLKLKMRSLSGSNKEVPH